MSAPMETAAAWDAVAPAWAAQVDAVDVHAADATTALLDAVAVRPGERVLELAAGPGSLAGVWSGLVGPSGSVVVSDLAPGMVELARSRSAAHANVEVRVLDAAAIDAPDASFDVVACRMGLMFTPDPSVALAEVHRVLRPGGRLGALTWGGVEHNPWMTCVGMAAMATGLVQGGPPTGPGGIFSLGDPDELGRLAEAAGFAAVDVTPIELTFRAESAEAHVAQVASLAGPLAAALQAASADQVAALHRTAATLAAPYLTGDGLAVPGRALLLSGRR